MPSEKKAMSMSIKKINQRGAFDLGSTIRNKDRGSFELKSRITRLYEFYRSKLSFNII